MSFDARHHANEPASGKPDLTRRGFLAGAAATGALGVIGVNLFVRQGFDPGGVANASRQNSRAASAKLRAAEKIRIPSQ